ncbi:Aste57867_13802 [Aphanomyces stellatus]|uniref:Aste57867_13802 protein n=1 Tax=Aphanomyces stellatus TaxID=120398 RepID=A0A485KZR8_9STRA|nr:hypothetical protein As57867_013752 [Aphanomyces stellatus]VFT90634.1 Aste57867_13802 [Aphanomyces stellatus]
MGQCCSKRQDVHGEQPHKPPPAKLTSTIEVTASSPQVPFQSFDRDLPSTLRPSAEEFSPAPMLESNNNRASPSGSPTKDQYGSSITSSRYIYTSPPSSPSKSSYVTEHEPQVDEPAMLAWQVSTTTDEPNNDAPPAAVYVHPEDRPIESLFIREERKRLAMIQEQLRLEREAAHAKWVAELREKKKEFMPEHYTGPAIVLEDFRSTKSIVGDASGRNC